MTDQPAIAVYGMVHLLPLLGSPGYPKEGLPAVLDRAKHDFDTYVDAGLTGAIFENFGDAPFFPGHVPPETVASMTWVISSCIAGWQQARNGDNSFKIGVNVLRNDAMAALAIAKTVGAQFIRVNIHAGASATDQGIINGLAHETMRYRKAIAAEKIKIFADVQVKHATELHSRTIIQEAEDLVLRAGVDGALILTGDATGHRPESETLAQAAIVKRLFPSIPLLVGSGVTSENVMDVYQQTDSSADGFIVGTDFKEDGNILNPVEPDRVLAFMDLVKQLA